MLFLTFREILCVSGPVAQFFWGLLFLQLGRETNLFNAAPEEVLCCYSSMAVL